MLNIMAELVRRCETREEWEETVRAIDRMKRFVSSLRPTEIAYAYSFVAYDDISAEFIHGAGTLLASNEREALDRARVNATGKLATMGRSPHTLDVVVNSNDDTFAVANKPAAPPTPPKPKTASLAVGDRVTLTVAADGPQPHGTVQDVGTFLTRNYYGVPCVPTAQALIAWDADNGHLPQWVKVADLAKLPPPESSFKPFKVHFVPAAI